VISPDATAQVKEQAALVAPEVRHVRDLSGQQWRSGIAAWLGWLFDGLDMHLYTLVYVQFVADLLHLQNTADPSVGWHASLIQGAFLFGWALGGGFFGRIGDRLGRSRALCLTVLTYAAFTGLSVFAQTWWHLFIFRFLAALGIGGEWAVGASLLSETWPKSWRAWIAAILQSAVNVGVLLAVLSNWLMAPIVSREPRYLFLVGIIPALLVFWIRRAVPEPAEWHAAKARDVQPPLADLFRGAVGKTTLLVIAVCALSLTAHWAFMFWHQTQLKSLPDVLSLPIAEKNQLGSKALYSVMVASIIGNFAAAAVARIIGYRRAIALLCFGYFLAMTATYSVARPYAQLLAWLWLPGFFQGVFALFTMYLPPLFPTLLRTTGAGFCYNIGRIISAGGVVLFGYFSTVARDHTTALVADHRRTLLYAGFLFVPAALFALFLPELRDKPQPVNQPID